jgi:hypothetical protein
MPLIRCTKKLLKELKAKVPIAPAQTCDALLGDWYANLLWIERRKCVIFTSERTHLTFFVAGVIQDALRDFATFFRRGLRQLLEDEGFTPAVVERVLDDYQELALAPTNDRSVLGSLNDLARMAAARAEYFGGLSGIPPGEMNRDLNLTPMGRLQMRAPIDATANILEGRDPAAQRLWPRTPPGEIALGEIGIKGQNKPATPAARDPDLAVSHLQSVPELAETRDKNIPPFSGTSIAAQEQFADEHEYVATEIPPGQPQIRYYPKTRQWLSRGEVIRCLLKGVNGRVVICIDDNELSLDDLGTLLLTYVGWGMRIEFMPDDAIEERPPLEINDLEDL